MLSPQIEIIILACLVAVACALPGNFLVLRRVSLMSDAISHSILFGIVIAFFISQNLKSPLMVVGAALTGVLTVSLTELVIRTRKLKEDAAIGLVFPLLFSLGVILINLFAKHVHLDTQCVLMGEIAYAPFDRLLLGTHDLGPLGFWSVGSILVLNLLFVLLYYKELKISTFDPGLAASLGFRPAWIHYALMTIVSITAVGAFESVGSILVVALMIVPPATAYLLTHRLSHMLMISAIVSILSAISGYFLAKSWDASISGCMALMSGVFFVAVWIFAPEQGLLARFVLLRFRQLDFASQMLAVHLLQSELTHAEETESIVGHMRNHMSWQDDFTSTVIAQCIEEGLIKKTGNKLSLTSYGREKAKNTLIKS